MNLKIHVKRRGKNFTHHIEIILVSSMKLDIEEANEYVYHYSDDIISDEVAKQMTK